MSRQRRRLRALRRAAFHRQHGLCWYCGEAMWDRIDESRAEACLRLGFTGAHRARAMLDFRAVTAEHLVRRADGGRTSEQNIVAACAWCNHRRGMVSASEWRLARRGALALPRIDVSAAAQP